MLIKKQLLERARRGLNDGGEMERKRVGAHRSLASSMSAGCIAKNRCFGRSTAVTLWLRLT